MKISWVDWNSVCRSKEVGGLGVRRIREFNNALLGKWCWRLLVEKGSLWCRVLSTRYGEEGGHVLEGGCDASSWWRVVTTIRREGLFRDNVSRLMGNGKLTMFWSDVWVGDKALLDRFSRLFDLSLRKDAPVFEMSQLGWGRMVRRGSGGRGCFCGRRSWWGNFVYHFIM